MSKVNIEIFNSRRHGSIYTTVVEVWKDAETGEYVVTRKATELGADKSKVLAITAACESILRGFKEPGVYSAWVDGAPYVNHEVRERVAKR